MVNNKQLILDIAMNLNRIGNWAADDYDKKQRRILLFLDQTKEYIETLDQTTYPEKFIPTMNVFLPKFQSLLKEGTSHPANLDVWAEEMMTWGNILTHRASML